MKPEAVTWLGSEPVSHLWTGVSVNFLIAEAKHQTQERDLKVEEFILSHSLRAPFIMARKSRRHKHKVTLPP